MAKFHLGTRDDPYSNLESVLDKPTLNNDTKKHSSVSFSDPIPVQNQSVH